MEKKAIQLLISNIKLNKFGPNDDHEDIILLRFALEQPFENSAVVENVTTISTKDAMDKLNGRWSEDFSKSLIFKTGLRGKAKLSIEIVSVDKDTPGEKAFKTFFKSLLSEILGVWTKGFGSAYVGSITSTTGTSLTDLIEEDEDADIIGKAEVIIDSERLDDAYELPLIITKPITKKVTRRNPSPGSAIRRIREEVVVIPAGENGMIAIKLDDLS
tara:strand:- start:1365 stop:2012 length:648 start_codon:yes stop_codon:yes gene_type:complete